MKPTAVGYLVTAVALLAWFGVKALLERVGLLDLPVVPDVILGLVVGYGCGRLGVFVWRTRIADAEVRELRAAIDRAERDGRNR